MLRKLTLAMILSLCITFALGSGSIVHNTETSTFYPEDFLEEIRIENMYSTIDYLSKQPRVAGTEEERQTVQYIKKKFEKMGYTAKLLPFPIVVYREPLFTKVRVKNDELPVQVFEYSGNGNIEAEVIYVRKATKKELQDIDLTKKIALIERGDIRQNEKIDNVKKKGAIGVIMFNNEGENKVFNGFQDPRAGLPTVAISRKAGLSIVQKLASQPSILASLDIVGGEIIKTNSYNVLATKSPHLQEDRENNNDPIISIGAHHDSVELAPGANDNASGTAVVLELARVLANKPIQAELRFLTFGAEEKGLLGSYYYTNLLSSEEKKRTIGHFQLDMVGSKDAGSLIMYTVDGKKNTVTDFAANASAVVSEVIPYGKMGRSDHVPFHQTGIASALFIHAPVEPWYHTPDDTIDKISKKKLKEVAGIVGTAIYHLALDPEQNHRVCYDQKSKKFVQRNKNSLEKGCIVEYPFESRELD